MPKETIKKETLNLYQKLVEIRKNVESLYKDTKWYNYNYVSWSQVLNKIRPIMDELWVVLVPNVTHNPEYKIFEYDTVNNYGKTKHNIDYIVNANMVYTWINADNPKETLSVNWSLYWVQDDISKAFGSWLTYSERYFLMKFFDIPTDDEDPDTKQDKKDISPTTTTQEKKSDVINKALEAVGNPQTPVETKPETKEDEAKSNNDADKIRYEEWEKYMTDAVFSLVEKKWPDWVTIDDLKNIGIDLMNKWNCNNTDKVYVALRDKILMPLINDLNTKNK